MRSIGAASAVLFALAQECAGHAYMSQPASRMAHRYNANPRAEFEPQSAGGGGGYAPCGKISGHDYTGDAWSSAQAATHQTIIKGGVVQTEVVVTAHHWGHFEFSVCDLDTLNLAGKSAAQRDALMWECFNKESNLLQRHQDYEVYDPSPIDASHPTRWYLPPRSMASWPPQGWTGAPSMGHHPSEKGVYRMWLKVPETVNCLGDNCVLFYFYYSSNSCEAAGYRQYMSGTAPAAGVKTIIATSSDTVWTCGACGDCAARNGAEDGAVHNGKRAFDHEGSLGQPERFYGCADVSATTGIAKASDLPPACSGAWCADQTCSCTPVSAAPTEVGQTNAPTKAPVTAAPQSAATPAPTQNAADCQCSQAKSWCQAKCVARSNGVSMNQCWGTPTTFLQCRCSDGTDLTAQSIAESGSACQCLHSTCPASVSAAPTQVAVSAAPTQVGQTAAPQTIAPTKAPVVTTNAPTVPPTPTPPPTTSTPTAVGGALSCDQCATTVHAVATKCGAVCAGQYCHGSSALSCGAGLVFAASVGTCDWPANHGCGATLAPTTAAPTAASGTLACGACFTKFHNMPTKCGVACGGNYCHGSAALACPSGLVFDADLSVCNWAASVQGCAAAVHRRAADLAAPRLRGSQK